jgi:hypothetical protein
MIMTDALLTSLPIPAVFVKYDNVDTVDAATRKELDTWKHVATYTIQKLHDDLLDSSPQPANLPPSQRVQIAVVASSSKYSAPWTNARIQELTSSKIHFFYILIND